MADGVGDAWLGKMAFGAWMEDGCWMLDHRSTGRKEEMMGK